MESVLMTMPPAFCASSSARADLPLAVGPAISTALLTACEFACMSLVATLICNPANPALDSTIVDGALAVLPSPAPGAGRLAVLPSPGHAQWLFDEVAVDIPFAGSDDVRAIEASLRRARGGPPIDICVQPAALRPPTLFFAD